MIYDEVHLLPAPVFRMTADLQARRRLGLTATLVREDGREGDVFSLIGPKRYDAPWKDIEAQGYIAPADCVEVRVTLSEPERMTYAVAEQDVKYRLASTAESKTQVVIDLVAKHRGVPILVIGQYVDQLEDLAARLDAPLITGQTTVRQRERLYEAFRSGEIDLLVVSKVANFSIDLPSAQVAIQVSGAFGSRQEEAQRLGRLLRPKAEGTTARFLAVGGPRHRRRGLRRPPAALPGRAGLRVHDHGRRGRDLVVNSLLTTRLKVSVFAPRSQTKGVSTRSSLQTETGAALSAARDGSRQLAATTRLKVSVFAPRSQTKGVSTRSSLQTETGAALSAARDGSRQLAAHDGVVNCLPLAQVG